MNIDPGYDPHHVLTMRTVLPKQKYLKPQQWSAFFNKVVEETKSIPGVVAAAAGRGAPMEGAGGVYRYHLAGRPAPRSSIHTPWPNIFVSVPTISVPQA